MNPTRILLVEDHYIMRAGLSLLAKEHPDFVVVGEAADAAAAWPAISELRPDLVVMDLDLPGENGASLTARVRAEYPEVHVVILTAHTEPELLHEALRAGASGIVLKANAPGELIAAMRAAIAGGLYLSPDVAGLVLNAMTVPVGGRPDGLTARELQVLKRLADGQTTKEIAFALNLSPKTVETHRAHLMEKLGVTSVAELTKYALRNGLTRS